MKTLIVTQLVAAAAAGALVFTGCGKKDDAAAGASLNDVSLKDLPSASEMLKSSSASSASFDEGRLSNLARVSGTAPLLKDLKANYDQYFWNTVVAQLTTAGAGASASLKNQFWGNVDGGPGGWGACRMAQGVGEAIGRMAESGSSACYMKNIPFAASGVTISGATADSLFAQTDADKMVKVIAAQQGGSMNVFIKVFGKNSVGGDVYKAQLYFCQGGAPNGVESFEINKATGAYAASSTHDEGGHVGVSTLSATLGIIGGKISIDPSKERKSTAQYSGSWGKFKADMTITGDDVIYSKNYNQGSYGTGKNYSVLKFNGGGLSTIRFLEGAFQDSFNDGSHGANSHSQGVEWHDSFYASVASSDLKTQAEALNMASDSFYTGFTEATADLSSYDCNAAVGATVNMDFADAGVAKIQAKCEGERFNDYNMCDGAQAAMHLAF